MTLLWLIGAALAAQLKLGVDTRELTVGETVAVEVQLVDGVARGSPELDTGAGLKAQFQVQSQSKLEVNRRVTRIVRYSYALTAIQPGPWTLGPATLEVDGETLTAPAVTIQVSPRSQAAVAERDATATLSDDAPYLGEVVVYRFRFQHRGEVLDARWSPPSYDGFVAEQVAEPAQREVNSVIDGQRQTVQQVDVPLVAAGLGARTISPALLTVQVPTTRSKRRSNDPFADFPFNRYQDVKAETLTAPAVPATVRPLPAEGRPADFSGLVGHFELEVRPSADQVKLGDSLTLEIRLSGDGTLSGFRLTPPPQDAGFRAYDDAPAVEAAVEDGRFRSSAVFRRAIVPEAEGDLLIPALRVPVFDPSTGAYAVLSSQALKIKVLPGEAGAGQVASFAGAVGEGGRPIESLAEDILPVPGDAAVGDATLEGRLRALLLAPALPLFGLVGLGVAARLRRRPKDPWPGLRARLASLPTEPGARLGEIEAVFREAVALRLDREAAGLSAQDAATLGEPVAALYRDLASARYGGMPVEDLESRVRRFLDGAP